MYDVIGKRCKLLLYISTKMDHLPVIKKKEHKKKMMMQMHLHTTQKNEYCRRKKNHTERYI